MADALQIKLQVTVVYNVTVYYLECSFFAFLFPWTSLAGWCTEVQLQQHLPTTVAPLLPQTAPSLHSSLSSPWQSQMPPPWRWSHRWGYRVASACRCSTCKNVYVYYCSFGKEHPSTKEQLPSALAQLLLTNPFTISTQTHLETLERLEVIQLWTELSIKRFPNVRLWHLSPFLAL